MFVKINGDTYYLWRAVDHEGEVLEAYVTKARNRHAALRFLRKAMKYFGQPKTIVTDGLSSYRAALKTIGMGDRHHTGPWLNNRIENSHHLSGEENERCIGSGGFEACATSRSFIPLSTITST